MKKRKNLECIKLGTHRFITNFLEGNIKNKKSRPSKKERTRTKNIAIDDLQKAHFQNKGLFFGSG
jgi:hypothetical protein